MAFVSRIECTSVVVTVWPRDYCVWWCTRASIPHHTAAQKGTHTHTHFIKGLRSHQKIMFGFLLATPAMLFDAPLPIVQAPTEVSAVRYHTTAKALVDNTHNGLFPPTTFLLASSNMVGTTDRGDVSHFMPPHPCARAACPFCSFERSDRVCVLVSYHSPRSRVSRTVQKRSGPPVAARRAVRPVSSVCGGATPTAKRETKRCGGKKTRICVRAEF